MRPAAPCSLERPRSNALISPSSTSPCSVEGLNEVLLVGFCASRLVLFSCARVELDEPLELTLSSALLPADDESVIAPFVKEASRDFPNLSVRYLREFQPLGTAGCVPSPSRSLPPSATRRSPRRLTPRAPRSGLYHYRDMILKGNPDQIFVLHSDVVCGWPFEELQKFHSGHRGVGTVMAVKVRPSSSNLRALSSV